MGESGVDTRERLSSADDKMVQRYATGVLDLGLRLFEYIYTMGPDKFSKAHPVRDLWENVFRVGEDQDIVDTPLAKNLLGPLRVHFAKERYAEEDLPPDYLDPGRFLSLFEEGGPVRVTINAFGPVRRVTTMDSRDSNNVVQKAGGHAQRTDEVADFPAVLRVKVRWGKKPHEEFTLRFSAKGNRILLSKCNVGGLPGETRSDIASVGRGDNTYTAGFYQRMAAAAGQARDLPLIHASLDLPEVKQPE